MEFPGQTRVGAVQFDLRGRLIQEEPHDVAFPADARFGGVIRFLGLHEALDPTAAGQRVDVETLWTVDAQPTDDLQVVVRLSDGAGRTWLQEQFAPFAGLHPTNRWLPGQFLRVPLFPLLPPTLPPGTYNVELFLVGADGRARFPDGSESPLLLESRLTVTRPAAPPRVEGVGVGGLRVQPEPMPAVLPPATTLPLLLSVQVEQPDGLPDAWEVVAEDEAGAGVWRVILPLLDGLPTAEDGSPQSLPGGWQRGDSIHLRYTLSLPPALAGRYRLLLRAQRGGAGLPMTRWGGLWRSEALLLGEIEIEARVPRTELPPFDEAATAEWEGKVRLRGYSTAPQPVRGGEALRLQLGWEALAPTERPYKIFLHAVDPQGAFVAGADAFFDVPSVAWQAGEVLLSEHLFQAGTLPPGRYTLQVGLYHEPTQERLLTDAPDFAQPLGTIEVLP